MNIDDMTLGEIKEIAKMFSGSAEFGNPELRNAGLDIVYENYVGDDVMFMCMNYFYRGKLVSTTKDTLLIEDPSIVYETGKWSDKEYEDQQRLPSSVRVMKQSIECFGQFKSKIILP
jgi:hypothetical protein